MNAFTRPSQQLRFKVRHALLRNLHHTSLYRRLIVANKVMGARLHTVGRSIHKRLNSVPKEGITLLNFMCVQLYSGKLAKRYGHSPTDECLMCHKPDSCTIIARECKDHEALRISRHNATCQLVHAAIRKTLKGGGALRLTAPDLVLISAALTCSGLGSRVRGTREVRGYYKKPPHLLVVSVGNSFDLEPARSGRRPSGGRNGGGGAIRGDVAPQPPTQVSFDVARSDGLKNSEMRQRGGGLDCQRGSTARCLVANRLAATDRGPAAAGTKSAAASARRCRPGLTGRLQTVDSICPEEERGDEASQGRDRYNVAAVRLQ
jgi:hypothetical protein